MDKLKDIVLSVLAYIGESKFRLFTVIILGILGFGGWIVFSEKDAFMATYRAQQALPKMNGEYEKAASFILKNSQAELIAIFDVNTILNTRKLVYFVTREGGQDKTMYGTDVGLLTKNYNNNNDVISMISGKVPCQTYESPQSYMGFIYVAKGVKWMCRISVPPEQGLFVGQISVGWKEIPDKKEIETEQTIMLVASSLLFNKR